MPHLEIDNLQVANKSIQQSSVIAGAGLLLMAVLAAFGIFIVIENLTTPGDATQTAIAITNAESLFRLGIVSLVSVAILDVVVAWALFRVFKPVSRGLSLLAAWFRLVYAGLFTIAISQLIGVLEVLNPSEYLTAFSTEQLHAQALLGINAFYDIWNAGLILFGLHLLLLGYLVYQSAYAPKWLGILVVIAGLGYVIDSIVLVLPLGYTVEVAGFTFVGEVVLLFWLLIKGHRIRLDNLPPLW